MKGIRVIVLGMLAFSLSSVVRADQLPANDPQIKTGGPLAASSSFSALVLAPSAPAPIITTAFTIESPSGTSPATSPCILMEGTFSFTSPQCYFENDIETDGNPDTIGELTFEFPADSISGPVTCSELTGSPFSNCSVSEVSGIYQVDFTGGTIPFHSDFTLDFAGFPTDFSPATTATVTPEPGALVLLLTGLGSLVMRRRRA